MTQPTKLRGAGAIACATFAAMTVLCTTLIGCSGDDKEAKPQAAQAELPKITPVPEMKYYVGGPVMKHDSYGRLRLGGFSGEVATPSSRGLLIGYKLEPDGKTFDYRTWVNGRAVSKSTGFLDGAGLLWFSNRETYDSEGKIIARQAYTYDDAAKVMHSSVEQLDPVTGAVIQTFKQDMPYTPVEEPDEDEEEDEEGDAGDAGNSGNAANTAQQQGAASE